jgi:hypothetical protein
MADEPKQVPDVPVKLQIDLSAVQQVLARVAQERKPTISPPSREQQAELLKSAYRLLHQDHQFSAGQLVKWKAGLKNRTLPKENDPAVVIQVLDSPICDATKTSGSQAFQEPLDILLGVIAPDKTLRIFYYDHRRFEPF